MNERSEKEMRRPFGALSRLGRRRSFWIWASAILLVGFALRTVRCFLVNRIAKDGVLYVHMARDYDLGPREKAFALNRRMPPLYPQLMVLVSRSGCSYEFAGRVISVLAGSLALLPFLLMARILFGDRVALVAMSLAAVHPSLVRSSAAVMRDQLFLLLFATAAACMIAAAAFSKKRASLLLWLASGVLTALSAATRGEGSELFVALVLWLCLFLFRSNEKGERFVVRLRRSVAVLALYAIAYFSTTLAVFETIKDTDSTWTGVDSRIVGYLRGLVNRDAEDVLKEEDTL